MLSSRYTAFLVFFSFVFLKKKKWIAVIHRCDAHTWSEVSIKNHLFIFVSLEKQRNTWSFFFSRKLTYARNCHRNSWEGWKSTFDSFHWNHDKWKVLCSAVINENRNMWVVNDKELEDRNDSDILTNTVRTAWHWSMYKHT